MSTAARAQGVLLSPERELLEAFLEDHREATLVALEGLTEEQARRRLVPSLTTLLGLVTHLTFVEQVWFHVGVAGRTREELGLPADVDPTFVPADTDTVASVSARYREVVRESRAIAAGRSLDDLVMHNRRSPLSLRWVYVHLVREYAQHNGHADILREQVLAAGR